MENQKVAFGVNNITKEELLEHFFKAEKEAVVIAKMADLIVAIEPWQWRDDPVYATSCTWAVHATAKGSFPTSNLVTVTVTALKGIGLSFNEVTFSMAEQFNFHRERREKGEAHVARRFNGPADATPVGVALKGILINEKLVNDKVSDDGVISLFTTTDGRFLRDTSNVVAKGGRFYVAVLCRDYVLHAEGGFPTEVRFEDWERTIDRYRVEYYGVGSSLVGVMEALSKKIIADNEHLLWEPEGPLGNDENFAAVSPTTEKDIAKSLQEKK